MRYAVTFLILGPAFAVWALSLRGWGYLLFWPALSATLVGIGYAGAGARVFGNILDRQSPVSLFVRNNRVHVLRPESGNEPNVFYVGIDKEVN